MNMSGLDLPGLSIFSGLDLADIQSFVAYTAAAIKRYGKKERILHAYQENAHIGVIVTGTAQVLAADWLGNENVGHSLERGALIGMTSAILSAEYNGSAIEAITSVQVLWIPYKSLIIPGPRPARIHGVVMKHILEAFAMKNVRMVEKLEILSKKSLRERIIIYLMQQRRHQQETAVRVPGRVQLARELDCNRSALTREIGLMQAEGLLACGPDWMQLKGRMFGAES